MLFARHRAQSPTLAMVCGYEVHIRHYLAIRMFKIKQFRHTKALRLHFTPRSPIASFFAYRPKTKTAPLPALAKEGESEDTWQWHLDQQDAGCKLRPSVCRGAAMGELRLTTTLLRSLLSVM